MKPSVPPRSVSGSLGNSGVRSGLFPAHSDGCGLPPADLVMKGRRPSLPAEGKASSIMCAVLGAAALSETETGPARERQGRHGKSQPYATPASSAKRKTRLPEREWETQPLGPVT